MAKKKKRVNLKAIGFFRKTSPFAEALQPPEPAPTYPEDDPAKQLGRGALDAAFEALGQLEGYALCNATTTVIDDAKGAASLIRTVLRAMATSLS